MRIFILGFENSRGYDMTTSMALSNHANFLFKKGLRKDDKYSIEDALVRYGNPSYASYDKFFGSIINNARAIFLNRNKLNAHVKLWKEGIRVPKIFFSKMQVEKLDFPVVRRSAYHSRASDIEVITEPDNFIKGSFYTRFIPSELEYRLHIMFGQCIRISKKIPDSEHTKIEITDVIRSSSTGWTLEDFFKHDIGIENLAIRECIKAMNIIGLDFGACDVIVSSENNLPYLLEINSAPRLSYFGLEAYSKEILEHLGLSSDSIKLGKIRKWEYFDILPVKYRKVYKFKKDRIRNIKGFD